MLNPRIRIRHIRCFLETARLGSLSVAAQELSVSQPAMSKTIRELEDILGRRLFDRANRRLTLTPAGRVFQQHAGAGFIELGRAQTLIQNAPRSRQRLAVGALPTAATNLLPDAALIFCQSAPDCMLRVSTGPNWLLMSQLREGSLDLVVGRMTAGEGMQGLTFRQLYSEQIAAIVRPDHPLCGAVDAAERLAEYALILPPPGAVIAPLVESYLSRHGVPPMSHMFETVSLAFGRKLVQSSEAIWFISQGVVASELAAGTLAQLDIGQELVGGPVGISMREDGAANPERSALIEALQQVATA